MASVDRRRPVIEFRPLDRGDLETLWEWHHRDHVARWFLPWIPNTHDDAIADWMAMIEGRDSAHGHIVVVDGTDAGFIMGYRVGDEPEVAARLELGENAVGADILIADPGLTGHGLGPRVLAQFYLRLLDETGLGLAVIDPEVENRRAIRAYEKAGFVFFRELPDSIAGHTCQWMRARRAEIETALHRLDSGRCSAAPYTLGR